MTDFYRDKKVVVTGGAGMVGSHLVEKLLNLGAYVIVIDDFSRGTIENLPLHKNLEVKKTFATSYPNMAYHLQDTFALFNLAAMVAGVTHNQNNNLAMFSGNITLQSEPIRAANDMRTPHVLQVSSVCVYPNKQTDPCDDTVLRTGDPNLANAGYAEAKRNGERLVRLSDLSHAVIVRPSNIYGPRDYFDDKAHVIPALIKKVLNDSEYIEVYGDGTEEREFLYVEDAADGMLYALEHGANKEVYNLGTGGRTCVSINALLAEIQDILGTNKDIIYSTEFHSGDRRRWSKVDKIKDIGWGYIWELRPGLERMIEWYLESENNEQEN